MSLKGSNSYVQFIRSCTIVFGLVLSISCYALDSPKWIEMNGSGWKPDVEMLSELETKLKPVVLEKSVHRGRIHDWETYTFQYEGRSPLLREKYIYVNAFCDEPINHPDLKNSWVMVFDGGACFFSAKYEPATKRLFDVKVNGVA
jgi:hypothetical protein